MRPCIALACLLAGVALAGCSNAHRAAREGAGGAVDTLLRTCAADRPEASMEALNDPAKAAFARAPSPVEGCLRVLGLRARDPSAAQRLLGRARLVSVHANDMGASAVVQTPGGGRSTVEVENVGGDWRVARGAR